MITLVGLTSVGFWVGFVLVGLCVPFELDFGAFVPFVPLELFVLSLLLPFDFGAFVPFDVFSFSSLLFFVPLPFFEPFIRFVDDFSYVYWVFVLFVPGFFG